MGSVASFLAQFTQGLTGTLQQHHAEQKKLELKEQEDQLNTLQMAAQQAASTGDTRAYGMILRKIGDFTSTGSGKKGAAGKSNIMHQFADMLENGTQEQQEVPNLPQSNFQPQMSFNQQGHPTLTPKSPDVIAAQNEAMLKPKFELVHKPLFETTEQRQEREIKLYETKRNIEADINERRDAAKAKTKLEEVRLRIQGNKDVLGLRNNAAAMKDITELANANALRSGRAKPNDVDLQYASELIIGKAVAEEDRVKEQVNKLKQDIKDAPEKIKLMKERIRNTWALGTERNRILAGQLNLGQARLNYEIQTKKIVDNLEDQYAKLNTHLSVVERNIADATEKGNDALRQENVLDAIETRKAITNITGEINRKLAESYEQAIPQGQGQGYQPQAGVQTVVPPQLVPNQEVTIGKNKFIIGKEYIVKGRRIVVQLDSNGQPKVREVQ